MGGGAYSPSQTARFAKAAVSALAFVAAAVLSTGVADAAATSSWAVDEHSAIRLIAGPSEGATRAAGLEIRLDRGWQTYWKAPGESGAPPSFDWSASDNVAAVTVAYPVPQRFDDADGVTFGYRDDVILPLHIKPREPAKPATLAGTVRYAVCGKVCIPVAARVSLTIGPDQEPDPFAAAKLDGFSGRVPRPARIGAAGAIAVQAVRLDRTGQHPALMVKAAAPGTGATLFAAGPGAGVPQRVGPDRWRVPLERAHGSIELVLADAEAAIAVPVALDETTTTP